MKTYVEKPTTRQRDWYMVDASNRNLGRLAVVLANTLRGKHKPEYTPHVDCGDFIVVVNAKSIAVTGNKLQDKLYRKHSGYMGGLKTHNLAYMLENRPEDVLRMAVKGMMPKNRLARAQLRKLKIYAGAEHPHEAQRPKEMKIDI